MVRYWGRRSRSGARVSLDGGEHWLTVVGVVGDVRQFGLERDAVAQVYLPLPQTPVPIGGRILVRTAGDPQAMATVIRNAVRSLDPNLPVENVRTLDELRSRYLATPRLTALLLSVFAALALLVTLAGITGVIATSVSQRTREFGLRMALGAAPGRLLGDILRQGTLLVALGLAAGLVAAGVSGRVLSGYLYRHAPHRSRHAGGGCRRDAAGGRRRVPRAGTARNTRGSDAGAAGRLNTAPSCRADRAGTTESRRPAQRCATDACHYAPVHRQRSRRIARVRSHSPPGRSRLHKKHITIAGWVVPAHMNGRYTPSNAG